MSRFNRLYYELKPYVPWGVRLALRRQVAARKRRRCSDHWPILESAGRAPEGWPGWPDGKRFGLVLTHDVEGPRGVERVRPLAELEMDLGFRSSFNFIPEGDYQTPPELRHWLARNGFEVGVHDLNHDGKLYQSRGDFQTKAKQINKYLKEWNAVGFRSGFMHHDYDWLHDLEVLYDASSFDTDPFEPQPDGVGTIFPFWMPGPRTTPASASYDPQVAESRGYVELPYTLPQDSTVFLLFREKSIDLWRRKTEWIVAKGGMVLVNVHPDYMAFDAGTSDQFTFPAALYRSFLQWIAETYRGQYWHGVPAALATYCRTRHVGPRPRKPRRVCMLSASVYERDNRVLRYAESLVERGDAVDVVAVADRPGSPSQETINGARLFRCGNKGGKSGQIRQLWEALVFLGRSSVRLALNHWRNRYDLVHVHNMPDFLVFAAWGPKLAGAALILDIHDIFPEFYATRFGTSMRSMLPRALCRLERLCAGFAHHVIVSNHLWRDAMVARSVRADRCSVFINSVDITRFYPRARSRRDDTFVIVYPGSFNWHQGLDVAIRAFAGVREKLSGAELHLYGRGPEKESLIQLADELGLNGSVRFFDPLPLDRMPQILADADLGIVPKRASDFFGNQAFSTKIMEFMSQGLPVIASRTAVDSYYYDDSMLRFFPSEDVAELGRALVELAGDSSIRERLTQNAREFVARNSWETRRRDYLDLVDSLIESRQ